jgi:predicted dehydrogenase
MGYLEYQREADRKIRVGLVGVGSHSYRNILPTLTYLPMELVAIADVDAELGAKTARQYGLSKAYSSAKDMYANEQLDAVLLCVSPRLHPSLAIEAFEAGLHVWMEKPVATKVSEVDAMIAARGDRIAVVGYKKVFMPATEKALELMTDDSMAPLRTIVGIYSMDIPLGDRAAIEAGENTKWLVDGCHPVSLLLALGGAPESVAVHRGLDDSGVLVIRHTGGAISNLHLAHGSPSFQPVERYVIFGGSQSIEIENSRKIKYQRGIPFNYERSTSFTAPGTDSGAIVWEAQDGMNTLENKATFTQGLYGELQYFADCILSATPATRANLEFARDVASVYEAALLSDGDAVLVADQKEASTWTTI